ncbi:MAG: sodium:proton antiporter NhaD, partial [Pseudomonadales bacterium]|nr:sodium:proton antiporter NhaD [Pseudomonadales bacterium]
AAAVSEKEQPTTESRRPVGIDGFVKRRALRFGHAGRLRLQFRRPSENRRDERRDLAQDRFRLRRRGQLKNMAARCPEFDRHRFGQGLGPLRGNHHAVGPRQGGRVAAERNAIDHGASDNLTTALLMGAVVLAVGADKPSYVAISFINIVVAANAGGAFSPFGDITTLMVWQSGHVDFFEFFVLFVPSLVNFLIPAFFMSLAIPKETPTPLDEQVELKRGAIPICFLFICTIATAVSFEQVLHLPPFLGMMTGLSYLFFYSYYIKMSDKKTNPDIDEFNIFNKVARAEWDTLLFFFGVIFCVGGLGTLGYLSLVSHFMYDGWGPTIANIVAGLLSAVVDNIPVMFAILTMNPEMDHYQWLLVTMTAGVGGSLLSVGSAAGVALMGQSQGMYTFFSHLKWSWAIGLGYACSIYVHYLINS